MKLTDRLAIFKLLTLFAFLTLALAGCQGLEGVELNLLEDNTAVFGGREVSPEERIASLIVGLRFKDASGTYQYCTGSWISSRWIITAAHCLPSAKEDLSVYLTTSLEAADEMTSLEVRQIIPHPRAEAEKQRLKLEKKWDVGNRFDLALIEVREISQVFFDRKKMNTPVGEATEDKLRAAGFGFESYDLYEGTRGKKSLKTALLTTDARPREGILYINQKGDVGICLGDSGSPLFEEVEVSNPDRNWENLVGVASSVRNPGSSSVCGGESRFVMIEPHRAWIESVITSSKKKQR